MAAGEERRKNALILSRVRRVQRALNGEIWLRTAVAPMWVLVTALALARIFLRTQALFAAPLLLAAAIAVWVYRARRRLVPLGSAAVIADRQGGLGGLLLTRLEVPVGEWELEVNERVRQVRPPEVRRARSAAALALAALFLGVALLVPLPPPAVLHVNAAAASKVAAVEAKADALAKENRLDEATEAELARLREELADNRFDAADWEAADGVEAALEQQAQQAAADLSLASEAAKALEEALTAAQGSDGAAREQEELERALQALSGNGGQTGEEAQGSSGSGSKTPAPGQVASLRKALENRQKELANAYGQQQGQSGSRQASRAGSNRGKDGGKGKGEGKGDGEGEGEGQGEGQGQGSESGDGHASRNVKGGPSRGGGEGTLVFGDQARMDPDRLKFEPLPPGQGGEAQELWGLRAADPKVREGPAAGASSGAGAQGEQAPGFKEGPLLPRNRDLLKRYFDSPR